MCLFELIKEKYNCWIQHFDEECAVVYLLLLKVSTLGSLMFKKKKQICPWSLEESIKMTDKNDSSIHTETQWLWLKIITRPGY